MVIVTQAQRANHYTWTAGGCFQVVSSTSEGSQTTSHAYYALATPCIFRISFWEHPCLNLDMHRRTCRY